MMSLNKQDSTTLVITPAVLHIIKRESLDINDLFILSCLNNNRVDLLDIYDKENEEIEVLKFQYQRLFIHGYIENCSGDSTYQISSKGKTVLEEINTPQTVLEKEEDLDFTKLCSDYLELFPKIKLPSGKYARASVVEIEKKMRGFIKKHKASFKKSYNIILTPQIILKATKNYIERYSKTGYMYMATSSYFIQKNEESALAAEIVALSSGLSTVKSNFVNM